MRRETECVDAARAPRLNHRQGQAIGRLIPIATAALAAGEGERVGENVGRLLGGWARSLYVGVPALVALMFLLNRCFADLAVFLLAATLVGGFVLASAEVAGAIRGIWQTITG
ncbi:hypothetical protein OM076_28675 [Solirubrobacter ginsenosidimutans]|uniref:Uncharacterized protein n=1 Tax=Solirubrobacter ginsenosidimutans TaxID=490573 RepID=A0A9X3S360_9ACTN|nr:hypothetical protein [Solirubrobacter ginsenosidimutans]MDA0164279.1 hypothetical protein [Solirubrobacter ginsenosidimutans]